jgi:uncharacterized protein (TIGR00290 family)
MKVGILYSGGKDSTFAIDYCMEKGWEIEYLLSFKPTRTDCWLFHYATVEHTPVLAKQLGISHDVLPCDIADPKLEAQLVKKAVEFRPKVDALVLGGTGLQATQIKSIQEALKPLGVEVFAAHSGQDHDVVMRQMLAKGYRFMITQIAAEGLTQNDLGKVLDAKAMEELFERSRKFGFHEGGEGGHFDTLTIGGPIFSHEIQIEKSHKVMEREFVGHLIIDSLKLVPVAKIEAV